MNHVLSKKSRAPFSTYNQNLLNLASTYDDIGFTLNGWETEHNDTFSKENTDEKKIIRQPRRKLYELPIKTRQTKSQCKYAYDQPTPLLSRRKTLQNTIFTNMELPQLGNGQKVLKKRQNQYIHSSMKKITFIELLNELFSRNGPKVSKRRARCFKVYL